MSNSKTTLSKKVKTKNIVLLVVFSFLLFIAIGGIFNRLAQEEDVFSEYIPNIILIPISVFFIVRSGLVLKGKMKPIQIPWALLSNIGTIIMFAFCFFFVVGLFFYALSEGRYGIMLFAIAFGAGYAYSIYFWIKKFICKSDSQGNELSKTRNISQHQQWEYAESKVVRHTAEYLEDITFIQDIKRSSLGAWKQYDILLAAMGYGWDTMKDWADYMLQADLEGIPQVTAGSMGIAETDHTKSFLDNGGKCAQTPELEIEKGMLSVAGLSPTLHAPVKIVWYNQTRVLRLFTPVDDDVLISCYVETMIRRTFGTDKAMKLGKPLPEKAVEKKDPVAFNSGHIHIDSAAFFAWKKENPESPQYEICSCISLHEKEPVIFLYEDGIKTREYCLQTEENEDFTGKYFHVSVRLGFQGQPAAPVAQIDGFVSDTDEDRKMTIKDIGYRMEGHFLACGEGLGVLRYNMTTGRDLPAKGLKYPGYTTPANVRLVGICPSCGKSFCFHGYAFYMVQNDVAYSDDGLDCCEILPHNIDKENWVHEIDGKKFRYYNSFNCPHCGVPYIDYKTYPDDKVFGVSGCVHLGRKAFRAE